MKATNFNSDVFSNGFGTRNKGFLSLLLLLLAFSACTTDRLLESSDYDLDSDGDGILDTIELTNGTDKNNPCDPAQNYDYTSYDVLNVFWSNSDCDNDGVSNADEVANATNPYIDDELDSDGDGILDIVELQNGTDRYSPCDPFQNSDYVAFNSNHPIWAASDCDNDGISNGDEIANSTNPYLDEIGGVDTDGDGVKDEREVLNGTDPNDPCDPVHETGYNGYDSENEIWVNGDCDGDGVLNGAELLSATDPYFDDRVYAVPEFLPTLSELQIFSGTLSNLELVSTSHEYNLSNTVFADYSSQFRSISLPRGEHMTYLGSGLPDFPDNTMLTMTFYYWNDERNPALGKKIIETRVMIKQNGVWNANNYVWNDGQTEAYLDEGAHTLGVNWVDNQGSNRTIEYSIPPKVLCVQCHGNNNVFQPIGPKMRSLNNIYGGVNQIEYLTEHGLLTGAPSTSQITAVPDWKDTSKYLQDRARAYLDINCAHCHQPGGAYNVNYGGQFDFTYETSFEDSKINDVKTAIISRMNSQIPGYFMPLLGTTVFHTEGIELIEAYIDTLN
ncbi:hypothetical protein [Allomuricauda sp. NBRC 101325]|uniref:hypothetical protein n=1 Tax=Allomuricauda sp. NBRC 101325 TaxID=1113758 RepID=UPI0024A5B5E6|nr:hypothetical protein [Muricauda sp. NBRC 101325]GLU44887.1 hypothetical protein Musp01_25110 [Muricauda sp. NBRC 101325]